MNRVLQRCAAAAWLFIAALAATGCAALKPASHNERNASLTQAGTSQAQAPTLTVEVDAPTTLRSLLLQHLDLVRLAALTSTVPVGETELLRLMQAAPQQVRSLLQTEGYFDPKVRLQSSGPDVSPAAPVQVRIEVDPGPRATVSQVKIEFEGALAQAAIAGQSQGLGTEADLRSAWTLRSGAPFRNSAWNSAKTQLLTRLRSAGYAAASLSGSAADVDPFNHTVRLFVVADSGPLFRSGEVEVEGLRLHERQTVLNIANFGLGTVLTEPLLLDFQDRLQKSGLFERASVALDPDPAQADAARVVVKVEEARAQQLVLGVGYSANTGQRATIEHLHRHLLGYPASAQQKAEWGRDRQAWEGELSTHMGPGLRRWFAGGALERLESAGDAVLTQRLRLGRARDTVALERMTFVEADRSVRRTPALKTESVAVSLNQHWSVRRLDSPLLPTDGVTLSLQGGAGQARDSSGAQGGFARLWTRVQAYRPIGDAWYGQARLEAGQVFVPSGLEVPEALRFRAGGDDSVRGYAYRSLGPVVNGTVGGGHAVLTGSVELARPLSERFAALWGAVFVDAGNAADSFKTWRAAVGYGAGLRWRSPVGPLRLDLAHGRDVGQLRVHFSVGIAF